MNTIASMTGFATESGTAGTATASWAWAWELRSVNARGLEMRFRLPPSFDRFEAEWRAAAAARLKRGTVSATLRLAAPEAATLSIDRALLARLLQEADLLAQSRPGTPKPRIESLLALPGVLRREAETDAAVPQATHAAITAGFTAALDALAASRAAEGGRLAAVLRGQLATLQALHQEAVPEASAQEDAQRARLAETLATYLQDWPAPPAERMAQELALLATRSDVTEEIDRLASHIEAARALLAASGPQGRQLDFLVQEFMREANTLCSKSASLRLTGIGLRMKGAIEQMREQVQNIE